MSRSKFMRWKDRLNRIDYSMWYWYHMTRIEYRNKPEKVKILDEWIISTKRPDRE